MANRYESTIIATPLLTEEQAKEVVEKYQGFLKETGAEVISHENWGLRKLAYPIQKKSTGFYHLFEFDAPPELIDKLETEYRRDERVLRYLTVKLDKHALNYAERRRKGEVGRKLVATAEKQSEGKE